MIYFPRGEVGYTKNSASPRGVFRGPPPRSPTQEMNVLIHGKAPVPVGRRAKKKRKRTFRDRVPVVTQTWNTQQLSQGPRVPIGSHFHSCPSRGGCAPELRPSVRLFAIPCLHEVVDQP